MTFQRNDQRHEIGRLSGSAFDERKFHMLKGLCNAEKARLNLEPETGSTRNKTPGRIYRTNKCAWHRGIFNG